MDDARFWKLIERVRRPRGEARDLDRLVEALAKLPPAEICAFDEILQRQLRALHSRDLWAVAYLAKGGCSDDGFEYFRAWVVSAGERSFCKARDAPLDLGLSLSREPPDDDWECEMLLYAAADAHERATSTALPPPAVALESAEPTGEPWTEAQLDDDGRFSRLRAHFGSRSPSSGGDAAALLQQLVPAEPAPPPPDRPMPLPTDPFAARALIPRAFKRLVLLVMMEEDEQAVAMATSALQDESLHPFHRGFLIDQLTEVFSRRRERARVAEYLLPVWRDPMARPGLYLVMPRDALYRVASACSDTGAMDEALAVMDHAAEYLPEVGQEAGVEFGFLRRDVLIALGRFEEALATLTDGRSLPKDPMECATLAQLHVELGANAAAGKALAAAVQGAKKLRGEVAPMGGAVLCVVSEAMSKLGRAEEALAHAERARELMADLPPGQPLHDYAERARLRALLALGRLDPDEPGLRQLVERAEDAAVPADLGEAFMLVADAQAARGRRDAARVTYGRAAEALHRAGHGHREREARARIASLKR